MVSKYKDFIACTTEGRSSRKNLCDALKRRLGTTPTMTSRRTLLVFPASALSRATYCHRNDRDDDPEG